MVKKAAIPMSPWDAQRLVNKLAKKLGWGAGVYTWETVMQWLQIIVDSKRQDKETLADARRILTEFTPPDRLRVWISDH